MGVCHVDQVRRGVDSDRDRGVPHTDGGQLCGKLSIHVCDDSKINQHYQNNKHPQPGRESPPTSGQVVEAHDYASCRLGFKKALGQSESIHRVWPASSSPVSQASLRHLRF